MNRPHHIFLRFLIRSAVRALFAVMGRLRIEGLENIPRQGGLVLAPNHVSAADWPAIGVSCPRPLVWMAKADLFNVPVIGPFARLFHAFPVNRDTADRHALRLAEERVRAGDALVIFPEGAVSEDAALQPFKPGLALVVLRTGVPVVPVGLIGTERLLPFGQNVPRPVRKPVRIRFGKPVRFDDIWQPRPDPNHPGRMRGVPPREAIDAATARAEAAVRALLQDA